MPGGLASSGAFLAIPAPDPAPGQAEPGKGPATHQVTPPYLPGDTRATSEQDCHGCGPPCLATDVTIPSHQRWQLILRADVAPAVGWGPSQGPATLPLLSSLALHQSPASHGLGRGHPGTCSPESAHWVMPATTATLTQGCGCHRDTLVVPVPALASTHPLMADTWHRMPWAWGQLLPMVGSRLGLGVMCLCWEQSGSSWDVPGYRGPMPAGLGDRDAERGTSPSPGMSQEGTWLSLWLHLIDHLRHHRLRVPHLCIRLHPTPLPSAVAWGQLGLEAVRCL